MPDKLQDLFDLQTNFQAMLGHDVFKSKDVQYMKDQILACIDELMEALRALPWKPWKRNQVLDRLQFKEELVDAWHFLINLTLASGMGPFELHKRFNDKNEVNIQRQRNDY